MKYIYISAILLAGLLVLMSSCKHEHGTDDDHAHNDETHPPHEESELEPFAFTIWTKKSELFVEFPPLIIGRESRFAAHFSEMVNFKAIEAGKVIVRLLDGGQKVAEHGVPNPSSPGIFRPTLKPDKAGNFNLQFILMTDEINDTITIPNIEVYPNEAAAITANPPQVEGDEVSFLKEQAWKVDFAIEQVNRRTINEVIHTSGEIQSMKGQQKMIVAKSNGIISFVSRKIEEGRDVKNGEQLFTISSKGLLTTNIDGKLQTAQVRVDKTKADFERVEELLAEQIIGRKEYEQRKMDYDIAKVDLQVLRNKSNTGSFTTGQSISSSMSGIIKRIMVTDGQYVEEGAPLMEITSNRRLILQAEVSQNHLSKLHKIKSANFRTAYQEEVQSIDNYNGRLVSYGKSMEQGSSFIPVLFELDNLHGLIPGSFVELFLLVNPIEKELVVSKAALMQDYSLNYVYVQTGGESFEKREVKLGVDDGFNVQIISGISEGEWVVTKGAYQIKMASMSSTIPAHGHEH